MSSSSMKNHNRKKKATNRERKIEKANIPTPDGPPRLIRQPNAKPSVDLAISLLESSKKPVVVSTEGKGMAMITYEYDLSVISLLKGLFRGSAVFEARLSFQSALVTNGAGTMLSNLGTNLNNYNQGSTWGLLFEEVRIKRTKLHIAMLQPNTAAVAVPQVYYVGYNPSDDASTTISPVLTTRLGGTKQIPSGSLSPHTFVGRPTPPRSFASSVTTGHSPLPVIDGCLGAWWIASAANGTVTFTYGHYYVESILEFRNYA